MEVSRRILFYGNSLILGSLGASLRQQPQFQVTFLLPPFPGKKLLEEMNPDVIFFDLEGPHPEATFSLLESRPGLLVIGISPDTNLVKIWTGGHLSGLSTPELLRVIDLQLNNSPVLEQSNVIIDRPQIILTEKQKIKSDFYLKIDASEERRGIASNNR